MLWLSRISLPTILLLVTAGLSGCGFHPMYAKSSQNTQIRERLTTVHIVPIQDRTGQILYTELMQRMRSEDTQVKQRYRLQVTIEETLNGINFQKNSTASGGEMSISANWQILDVESGRRLDSGKFSSVDSVNFLGPRYASIAAERDTERRTLENLADLITDRVVVFLSSHPQ